MTTTSNYEYPSGEKPSKEEQRLFDFMAKVLEGKQAQYLFVAVDRKGTYCYYGANDIEGAIDLNITAAVILNEQRRQKE